MRAELNDARLKVADLRDEVKRLQDSHHAHTSENIALRSQLAKLQRIIATCESCTAQRREIEEATAKLRTEMAAKLERGDEGMASDGYAEEDELISNGGLEQMN
jgi:predicted RNase H-like nuclease (RuvC/YqgF family)